MESDGANPSGRDSSEQASAPESRRPFSSAVHLEETDSTNSELLRQAAAGAPEGTVVVARRQTAGRGRHGRHWADRPGASLLCSLLFRPSLPSSELHLFPTLVSLAALDACYEVSGFELACKWPNDLVDPGGAKVAGLLSEVAGGALVVGIGVNCGLPDVDPGEASGQVSSLEELMGKRVDPAEVLDVLLAGVASRHGELISAPGAEAAERLMAEYRWRCSTIGQRVSVETATGLLIGTAVEIDSAGRLVLEGETGRLRLSAGDVVHLRPARRPGG